MLAVREGYVFASWCRMYGTALLLSMNQAHIRNFAIIAHIDHGKSTLADRLLELTGTVLKRDMQEQVLDSNPIERERGITIKLAPVRMKYQQSAISNQQSATQNKAESSELKAESYIFNLIDTPGHVDFGYEVSRSLAACEGALLVVDATQGVQAQTLANLHQARAHNLTIIPIINKIDLPNANISESVTELRSLGFREEEILQISAKTGENVEKVLDAIVERIPSPKGDPDALLRALIFSSHYDAHRGVVVFVRVVDGSIYLRVLPRVFPQENPQGDPFLGVPLRASPAKFRFLATGFGISPIEVGYFSPKMISSDFLRTGEVGYIATGLKDIKIAKVGDTITEGDVSRITYHVSRKKQTMTPDALTHDAIVPLPGYKEPKPMVFLGLFPIDSDHITEAREAMERLQLSDSAFTFRPISSMALGNGFHCGFLGLLHAEIVQERLQREFGLSMIATAPTVEYKIKLKNKTHLAGGRALNLKIDEEGYSLIQSADEFPDPSFIEEVREPVMQVAIYSPKRYVGPIMQLAQEKRGEYVDLVYQGEQAEFTYLIPLSEMIIDFFDALKSITEGYASLDYEFYEYRGVDVAKVDILVNKEKVDALSFLAVEGQAHRRGKIIVERLADVIPRQQFNIPIQAAIGGQIVARADVKPFRKDVIQKLYGGDRTRKDKLLDKQKKGKEKMKMVGRVEIPQQAFFHVLKRNN